MTDIQLTVNGEGSRAWSSLCPLGALSARTVARLAQCPRYQHRRKMPAILSTRMQILAGLDPSDDIHASGAYRKQVAAVVVRRALSAAIQEARS